MSFPPQKSDSDHFFPHYNIKTNQIALFLEKALRVIYNYLYNRPIKRHSKKYVNCTWMSNPIIGYIKERFYPTKLKYFYNLNK